MNSLPEALRAALVSLWRSRVLGERETSTCYTSLAHALAGRGAPQALLDAASEAAGEERKHEALCGQVLVDLGATVPVLPESAGNSRFAPKALSSDDAVIYEGVALGCFTETLNVALLSYTLEHVRQPKIARVLRAVLKDEVKHSRLGWGVLAWGRQRSSCDWLGRSLPALVDAALGSESTAPGAPDGWLGWGLLPQALHRQIVTDCLEQLVLPGLRAAKLRTPGRLTG